MCTDKGMKKKPKAVSEILIDGQIINVTNFIRSHPGGSIIKFMVESDGTDAFKQFHSRSKRANKILKALPKREATPEDLEKFEVPESTEVLEDFRKLTADLRAEGWFDASPSHVLYRIFELVMMHIVGFYLLINNWESNLALTALSIFILGIAQGRCGWFMHEGGHVSLTGCIWLDHHMQRFFYGFGCGMSAIWWRIQHNKHHATPQKLKHDPDLRTLPLVAFCEEVAKNARGYVQKSWIKVQNIFFIPITCFLVAMGWTLYLHPNAMIRKKEWMEAFWIFVRYAFWTYLGQNYWGWKLGILFYCADVWVASTYIFTNFAVSHTHLDTVDKNEHVNWITYASHHTMNCSHTWWCNWWMAYLNFQIEHHLFPSMPQYRFAKLSPRIKEFFKKHNYPYLYTDYFTALSKTMSNLKNVGHAIG